MPKSAPRQSGPAPRSEPYSTIRPGDKPAGNKSEAATTKALTEKPAKSLNASSKAAEITSTEAIQDKLSDVKTKPSKKRASANDNEEPAVKKSKSNNSSTTSKSCTKPTPKPTAEKTTEKSTEKPASFLDIVVPTHLDSGNIPIYDTCSTIRQKINALLGKDNQKPENGIPGQFKKDGTPKAYTQAQFLRDIGGGTTASMGRFLKAKKIMGGAESPIYPGAYEFFEKKRIFENKKKTNGRMKVEEDMPNGLPLRDPNHMRILMQRGEDPRQFLNAYGN
ncbi:hypothetical protein LSUE1_G004238 [Lachnellula suecica]|uniref:DUF7726 domain-containing protein n=1 Tax=Lachnellula suecica TaxID=602035 RepID=A0A8T9C8E9_9HELO|nr:hypothetical protein LSUE1_G004238 [Lachnellula suecica]